MSIFAKRVAPLHSCLLPWTKNLLKLYKKNASIFGNVCAIVVITVEKGNTWHTNANCVESFKDVDYKCTVLVFIHERILAMSSSCEAPHNAMQLKDDSM